MFLKINLVGLLFFILPLILASDTGNQKEDVFYNCNNYQENDSFDLSVPEKRTCTKELKIVFVSKDRVMSPVQDSEENNYFLLLDYLDDRYKHKTSSMSFRR
uniref:Secreted protein n=1 Tax=Strongyloides papillosus TaxID=174720 RepID=A0A0N5C2S1_STREA